MQRKLYDSVYLNFLSSIPRPLLESLATQVAASNTSHLVAQVYDQYLNFIVTEENLFASGIAGVYHTLNDPRESETTIESILNRIVDSLFSVAVTMGLLFYSTIYLLLGVIPIIRCPKGNAAEIISQRLDAKLRDYSMNSRGVASTSYSLSYTERPGIGACRLGSLLVMIILDRNLDLIPMISHSWTVHSSHPWT